MCHLLYLLITVRVTIVVFFSKVVEFYLSQIIFLARKSLRPKFHCFDLLQTRWTFFVQQAV